MLPLRTWLITKHAFTKPEYCVSPVHSFPVSISNTQECQILQCLHTAYLLCMLNRNRKERFSGLLDCMREFTRLWWVVHGLFIAILASVLIIHCGENNVFNYNHAAHKIRYNDIKPFVQLDLHLIFKLDQCKILAPRHWKITPGYCTVEID